MPEAIPARFTGTEPVSECEAGVPAKPTPIPINAYPSPTCQYGDPLTPEQQHGQEAEETKQVSEQQRCPGTVVLDQLRGAGSDQHHQQRRREDGCTRLEGRVAENILQELLADEHRAHQRSEDDDPGDRRDPEDATLGDVQVVERALAPGVA